MSGTECTGLSEILSGHADWNGLQYSAALPQPKLRKVVSVFVRLVVF